MKRLGRIVVSILIFTPIWWALSIIFIALNHQATGRLTGGITAIGGIASLVIAFKLTKWINKRRSNKKQEII